MSGFQTVQGRYHAGRNARRVKNSRSCVTPKRVMLPLSRVLRAKGRSSTRIPIKATSDMWGTGRELSVRCDPEQFLDSRSERNSSRESIGILPIANSSQDSKSPCDWSESLTPFRDTSQNGMLQVEAFPYLILSSLKPTMTLSPILSVEKEQMGRFPYSLFPQPFPSTSLPAFLRE
jgi:hypothetical protein